MKFYSYHLKRNYSYDVYRDLLNYETTSLELRTYSVVKKTPKGYWIQECYNCDIKGSGIYGEMLCGEKFWVANDAVKKRAYPTKKEALNSFIKRQEKKIKIVSRQLKDAEIGIKIAEKKLENLDIDVYRDWLFVN